MKKLFNNEMKKINGGVEYITTTGVCEGFDNNVHNWHSVVIKGKGTTTPEMVKNFNKNLNDHKTTPYYLNFSHSLKPL